MRQFRKNILRLAWKNRGAMAGSALIIAIGIFTMAAMFDTMFNLTGQIRAYYERAELGDIFCTVEGITDAELKRTEEIPGIRKAAGRMSADTRILADGLDSVVTVHLMSAPSSEEEASESLSGALNRPECSSPLTEDDRIFIGERMQAVYGWQPGDEIRVLYGGRSIRFYYGGTVSAPDYIYSVPPSGSMVPDGRTYDIAVVTEAAMRTVTGSGKRRELSFRLSPGYSFEDVRPMLSQRLERFSVGSLLKREDQASYSMVKDEVQELVTTGTVLPVIFLSISVFMLYTVLRKMIDRDRSLIGTMKALGMTDQELTGAYLIQGLLIGTAGALAGGLAAGPFGRYMFAMYVEFFNLPDTVYHDFLLTRAAGAAVAVLTAVSAVLPGIRSILRITPAMAMRPRSPEQYREIRLPGPLGSCRDLKVRMAFRSLLRNPFRGFLIALSVAFPFSMSSVLLSYGPVINDMMETEFGLVEDYDFMVTLNGSGTPLRCRDSALTLPGVRESDAVYVYPCEFILDSRHEYGMLHGRSAYGSFWKIRDNSGRVFTPPRNGILLDKRIAEKLHAKAGDEIEILPGSGSGGRKKVRVEAVIEQMFGTGACMALEAFPEQLDMVPSANRLLLRTERGKRDELKERLLEAGRVTFISEVQEIVKAYREMFGSMTAMIDMFSLLSVAAGGILISNILLISLRERVTELTTLRVMGMSDREIGGMLLLEQTVLFAAGILMGLPGNAFIRRLLESMMQSESYVIRLPLNAGTCGSAFLICMGMAFIAWRREMAVIKSVPLTDALKERGE